MQKLDLVRNFGILAEQLNAGEIAEKLQKVLLAFMDGVIGNEVNEAIELLISAKSRYDGMQSEKEMKLC